MRMNWGMKEDSRSYRAKDAVSEYNRKHKKTHLQPKCYIAADTRQPHWDATMTMITR